MHHFLSAFRRINDRGRSSRTEYWSFMLAAVIIEVGLGIVDGILGWRIAGRGGVLGAVFLLVIFFPAVALTIRRLHDTNRGAGWILLNLVPYIGWLVVLFFAALDSQPGDNQYGPNPKGVEAPPAQPA